MLQMTTLAVVLITALFFLLLGTAALFRPLLASQFLLGFAGSATKHYVEIGTRFAVGGSFLVTAPRTTHPSVFALFGWVLIISTAAMLLIPWRWHQRFAHEAVPRALRYLALIGVSSLTLGVLIILTVILGNVA